MRLNPYKQHGFTLIEVMVSISIFAIVMLSSTAAVFSIVEANKKTHSLKSVMTNLNFALESMMREIRTGSEYNCDGMGDCAGGGSRFRFKSNEGYFVEYTNELDSEGIRRIKKTKFTGGNPSFYVTAKEIAIEHMRFHVLGTDPTDDKQPKVVFVIRGNSGTDDTTKSNFTIQTTVSQRALE